MRQLRDDNFFKGLEILENISFVSERDVSLKDFEEVIKKREAGSFVIASPVTHGKSAIYKATVLRDTDYDLLYLCFPKTDNGLKKFVIGWKVINRWEEKEKMQAGNGISGDCSFGIKFTNNPFAGLKEELKRKEDL